MKPTDDRVKLVSITRGADFEIDVSRFAMPAAFACVDDAVQGAVKVLEGLEVVGRITIADRGRFMWLDGPRDCVLMRALPGATKASFRSLGIGEFCVEIYYVPETGSPELLIEADFCFK